MKSNKCLTVFLLGFCAGAKAQIPAIPQGAAVNLYFPHLADGGPSTNRWQTGVSIVNPSEVTAATANLYLYGDDGTRLSVNFGTGPTSAIPVQLPPRGEVTLWTAGSSSKLSTGWAELFSNTPLQATVQFRLLINGNITQEVAALASPSGQSYVSPATYMTGIALANIYVDSTENYAINVYDMSGNQVAASSISLPPLGHTAFNLGAFIPDLTTEFNGSIRIVPQNAGTFFVGLTLNFENSGVTSSLPSGVQAWPGDQWDRIWDVYMRNINAAQYVSNAAGLGLQFDLAHVPLKIATDQVLNAFALRSDNSVTIETALAELISDSASELGFIVAHEIGHVIQYRTNALVWAPTNAEVDADEWGMILSIIAGYDPYAAAGALSKLAMATNNPSLISQTFDNISGDLPASFNNRSALVYTNLQALCHNPTLAPFCLNYKALVHPHFPNNTPLSVHHRNR